MKLIEFGGQVIDQIDASSSLLLANQMTLGDPQRADHQLLLAPGKYFCRIMPSDAQSEIGTLRAGLCVSHGPVAVGRSGKHIR